MRRHDRVIAALVVALVVGPASPAASADEEFQARGYLLSRFQLYPADTGAVLYPTLAVEKFQSFLEGNLDLTLKGDRFALRSDTSALYRVSPSGCRAGTNLPGCLIINELYATLDVVADHLAVLVGRHRASWGSALSFHPVEPMNPAPDPTDPSFQRLGAWTAMLELHADAFVVTAAWFPAVIHSAAGTPDHLDVNAGLAGGRIAWRPAGFDLSAIGYYDVQNRLPEVGASGSAVLGDWPLEVHGEVLMHQRRAITTGTLQPGSCPIQSLDIPHREVSDVSAIGGMRWDHGDGTLVNLEYLHDGDGLVADDFNAVVAAAEQLAMTCPAERIEPSDVAQDGRPQQFASVFLRRNYAIMSAVKPRFADEGVLSNLGANASVLAGLDDRSGVVSARAVYTVHDTTIVRLGGLVRFGGARTQYGILPFHGMVLLDVQTML
jgi:hypothetical protein